MAWKSIMLFPKKGQTVLFDLNFQTFPNLWLNSWHNAVSYWVWTIFLISGLWEDSYLNTSSRMWSQPYIHCISIHLSTSSTSFFCFQSKNMYSNCSSDISWTLKIVLSVHGCINSTNASHALEYLLICHVPLPAMGNHNLDITTVQKHYTRITRYVTDCCQSICTHIIWLSLFTFVQRHLTFKV